MPSAAREESGWMDLLQFVTPSSAAGGQHYKPKLDPTSIVTFIETYEVNTVCEYTMRTRRHSGLLERQLSS